MPDDIPKPAQEGAIEVTYETLGDLFQGSLEHRMLRVKELTDPPTRHVTYAREVEAMPTTVDFIPSEGRKMPSTKSGASMTREEFEEMVTRRVAEEMEAREAARTLEPLNENGDELEGENGGNGNGNGGNGNGNGGNGNGNGGNGGNGNGGNGNRNGNHGMNYGGFMPVARECTFQDFLKCKPHNFSGTEGVVGLTRWFEKMETVFNISNCPLKYQVKYATCTLQDSALTWWNSHKRTIGVEAAYTMNWVELMKLMTEVYCPRNEIQKMETELWNLAVKGNDLTAYTQRFQELILLCTRMVPDEEDRVERFIGGLPDNIQGNVIAANPTRLQDAIRIANQLMDKKVQGYAARSAENKRRMESNLRDNRGQLSCDFILDYSSSIHQSRCLDVLLLDLLKVMAISVISVSLDSSEESEGTSTRRVILFGTIPTTIPDTTLSVIPPTTHIDTTPIPTVSPTIPPSPDYTPASPDYSPASDTEFDPSKDPSSDHIPPLSATSPFLSSIEDFSDSDILDTPPLPTHDHFSSDDSSRDSSSSSSSKSSSDSSVDALSDSASSHLSSNHSLPTPSSDMRPSHHLCSLVLSIHRSSVAISDRPSHDSSSASPSRKRSRSPAVFVPLSSPTLGALSYARADLLPSPKRIRSLETATDLEGCSEDSFESYVPREAGLGVDFEDESSKSSRHRGTNLEMDVDVMRSDGIDIDPEIQAKINECIAYADALRDRGIDARLEQDNRRLRDMIDVASQRVTRSQRRELHVQREMRQIRCFRFYDRMRIARLKACARRYLGYRVLGARTTARNLEPLMRDGSGQEEVNGNGGNENGGNGNRGNGNGNENGGGNGYHFEGFMPAQECTYQDFLKCQPLSFNGT
ncbi:putative reverse transcriptase domain-containing protein [Tanacetum coccineum]